MLEVNKNSIVFRLARHLRSSTPLVCSRDSGVIIGGVIIGGVIIGGVIIGGVIIGGVIIGGVTNTSLQSYYQKITSFSEKCRNKKILTH